MIWTEALCKLFDAIWSCCFYGMVGMGFRRWTCDSSFKPIQINSPPLIPQMIPYINAAML